MAARIGKPEAITATARKVAILAYRVLKGELIYQDIGIDGYNAHQRARVLNGLRRPAARLGFELVTGHTEELIGAAPLSRGSSFLGVGRRAPKSPTDSADTGH